MRAGSHHGAAAREKMATTHREIHQAPWNKGKKMSADFCAKISAIQQGKPGHPHSPEARAKIAAAMQGKRHALGCVRSEETRAKMGGMRGKRGPLSPFWKGGRKKTAKGYVKAFAPDHPYADAGGYVFEHRLIVEKVIGRYLKPSEKVHHNERKDDNHGGNLVACQDDSYHKLIHRRQKLVGKVPAEILKDNRG